MFFVGAVILWGGLGLSLYNAMKVSRQKKK